MDIFEIQSEVENLVNEYVQSSCKRINASELGLDNRCGSVYVNTDDEVILVKKSNSRNIEYYGGFEYIDESEKSELADYVVYHSDSERVQECFDHLEDNSDDSEEFENV